MSRPKLTKLNTTLPLGTGLLGKKTKIIAYIYYFFAIIGFYKYLTKSFAKALMREYNLGVKYCSMSLILMDGI
jgi:hypothetical protein